jgi:predicted dienelactone hydrolase
MTLFPTKHRILKLSILLAVSILLLGSGLLQRGRAGASRLPADPALAYKLSDGPYSVETIDQTIHDSRRNKDLPVRILVPKSSGPFPVIVFSHGAGGSGQNYFPLTGFWATHGYIVIQPTHNDSIALRRQKGESLPSGPRDLIDDYRFNSDDWANRALDISFVIDSLQALEKQVPQLKGRMDQKRIAMAGHSYGAFTTQMIGGALVDFPNGPKAKSFRDDRPIALMMLSPQGKNQNGLTENSWKSMTRPMMSMTGTYDNGAMQQVASWRKDPFTYSPPGDKYHVFIDNAFHMSFTGALAQGNDEGSSRRRMIARLAERTDQKVVFDYVKIASIAFWDAYLKNDIKARSYLKSNGLSAYSHDSVKIDQK